MCIIITGLNVWVVDESGQTMKINGEVLRQLVSNDRVQQRKTPSITITELNDDDTDSHRSPTYYVSEMQH